MNEKEAAIMYLKSIVAILEQNANFPADMDIIDGYVFCANISLQNYKNEILGIAERKGA